MPVPENSLAAATAQSAIAPGRPWTYSNNDQVIGSCMGWGMCGFQSGKTSNDGVPYRTQSFAVQLNVIGAYAALEVPATEIDLLSSGNTGPLTSVGFPPTFTGGSNGLQNHNWTSLQTEGLFFSKYCFLLLGLGFKPLRAVQVILDGPDAGKEYSGPASTDSYQGIVRQLFQLVGNQMSGAFYSLDEECLCRIEQIETWQDNTGHSNDQSVLGGGARGMDRDYMALVKGIVCGGRNSDRITCTLSLENSAIVANPSPAPFAGTAALDQTRNLSAPFLMFRCKFWGYAICCPDIGTCQIVL